MKEEKEWVGKWAIITPQNQEIIVYGVLKYSPLYGCILKASTDDASRETFDFIFNAKKFLTINGLENVTHRNVLLRKSTTSGASRSAGISITLTVSEVFDNIFYDDVDDLKFDRVVVDYSALSEWIDSDSTYISYDFLEDDKHGLSITYTHPENIYFDINDKIKICFAFGYSTSHEMDDSRGFYLENNSSIIIYSKAGSLESDKLVQYSEHFRRLLSLMYYSNCYIYRQRFFRLNMQIGVERYFKQENIGNSQKRSSSSLPLMKFSDIKNVAEEIFRKWFLFNESGDLTYVSWVASRNITPFSQEVFLEFVRGLEVFHKTKVKQMSLNSRLQAILDKLKSTCNESEFNKLFPNIKDACSLIKENRNYLTHYGDGTLKPEYQLELEELYQLTIKCKIVLITIILEDIGIDSAKTFSYLFERHRSMLY
ncbi:hypothetical protein FAES_1361 [Fibrella aestuarina BUZ 2]|uniref:Uncharacterized protein n=1 Tax=Fibrella aestuarina BUZ 2 TaxID=1166018 RepID=I0K5G8_9BACT|nr:HEPN domain-containing protein [Fibrella aestuarina]CCG99371.1 hypothetical protein FAES_1361 [Fibrella aestuarina BUZ 2]